MRQVEKAALHLEGVQLVAVSIDGTHLVLDLFGGEGCWDERGTDGRRTMPVDVAPVLAMRAPVAMCPTSDLDQLLEWCADGEQLEMELEIEGGPLGARPRRFRLGDGRRRLLLDGPQLSLHA
ncbi:MAG TPA: hypothetical protein VM030_06645 [Acidimicrobiales bacterium]|nr:hypothetical protein [Acidimicrobiales bacterium]